MRSWQGEERDRSDEEWEQAYAALDPRAQLGWGNRFAVSGGSEDMVRDVFVAADAVHAEAMSAMDGNASQNDGSTGNGPDVVVDSSPASPSGSVEGEGSAIAEMEGVEGEEAVEWVLAFAWKFDWLHEGRGGWGLMLRRICAMLAVDQEK
jgi:hypothetical protein